MTPPQLSVLDVQLFERRTRLRIPFKFGANTLTEAPQVFVRAEVEIDGKRAFGQSAELLAPKWFDKDQGLDNEQNFDQLRRSLAGAARLYRDHHEETSAFGLHAAIAARHYRNCADEGLNGLIASYGLALLDRAVLDALCRLQGVSVFEAMRLNLPGLSTELTPDLAQADLEVFLAGRTLPSSIAARHTVGMSDPLTDAEIASPLRDGYPQSLEAVIATYGNRYFKLKVGGDIGASVDRLTAIAAVLDRSGDAYHVTLDGNEQFADSAAVLTMIETIRATPALSRLWSATLFLEQPLARQDALEHSVEAIAAHIPVVLDESDSDLTVFSRGRQMGYAGVSAKSCKGVYRAILNAARAAAWNRDGGRRYFVTAEDLTVQGGIALQQSLALACLVGADHIELNGHHYVGGFGTVSEAEQQRFATAHPDIYALENRRAQLRIADGKVSIGSLEAPGFAGGAEPDWWSMEPVV